MSRSLAAELPREMNEWWHEAVQPSLPFVYSPRYLAWCAADYADRAYILACDSWNSGDRVEASWFARVYKSHCAVFRSCSWALTSAGEAGNRRQ